VIINPKDRRPCVYDVPSMRVTICRRGQWPQPCLRAQIMAGLWTVFLRRTHGQNRRLDYHWYVRGGMWRSHPLVEFSLPTCQTLMTVLKGKGLICNGSLNKTAHCLPPPSPTPYFLLLELSPELICAHSLFLHPTPSLQAN
jgi:hypothetical protein